MTTIEQQITCIDREIGMRQRVYPRWVAQKKMSQEASDREIATMTDVLTTLRRVKQVEADEAGLRG